MRCSFIPPYVLEEIATAPERGVPVDPAVAARCRETLQRDAAFRQVRGVMAAAAPLVEAPGGWTVHDAEHGTALPGTPVRDETAADPHGDIDVDDVWTGCEAVLRLFREVYGRASYDDEDARVIATVHYSRDYANAFWDGSQLVFGDGDGQVFGRMTKPVDVLGHEFTHAVTEYVAGLVYRDQSGALNESMSDVFGSCLKQRILGQTAEEADWLIGEGIFVEAINGRALRDMANPGTAYDDPLLGKDPQPGHMDDFIVTRDDSGGVHLNSGIPNRAFHLAATAIGGASAEGAGRIWYAALATVSPRASFADFAEATVAVAGEHADVVRRSWESVGVMFGAPEPEVRPPEVSRSGDRGPLERSEAMVRVRRSGGLAGRTVSGDIHADDARVVDLLERIDLSAIRRSEPYPDMFTYEFVIAGQSFDVSEPDMTDELRALADLVLSEHS